MTHLVSPNVCLRLRIRQSFLSRIKPGHWKSDQLLFGRVVIVVTFCEEVSVLKHSRLTIIAHLMIFDSNRCQITQPKDL